MTAEDGVELCGLLRPRTALPVHYEGWSHFQQDRAAMDAVFAGAPLDVRTALRWLPIGEAIDIEV
jgi:L-ascorbate metabolism protein UlaG (beta-lactamase superfamily)